MKFNKTSLMGFTFFVGFASLLYGAFGKITHSDIGIFWLALGMILSYAFLFLAIAEISKSKRIQSSEKSMWIIGLILVGTVTGFFYLTRARQRIINS